KRLAKFYSLPGIVSIKDFFQENGTAYLVMEYVEGETLKQHLSRVGGKVPATEIFELMKPLMNSLIDVHNTGIIHRDISPDNIIITKEGNIKLLDFGAARDFSDSGNKSLSVMLKPGYAPEEQYRSRGVQGPWTDIYALCGTMYKAITGITPDESSERLRSDELRKPSELGIEIHPRQESALMKGMAVFQENRFQSINALMEDLFKIPDQSSYEPEAHIDQAIEKQAQNSSEYKSDLNNQVDLSVEKEIQTTNNFKQKIKIFGSVIVIAIIILTFIGFYVKYSHSGHSGSLGSNVSVQTENDSTNTDTLNTKVVKNSKDNNQENINTGSTQGEKTDSDETSSNISTIMSDSGNTSGNIINNGHIAAQGEWIYYSFNGGLDKMKADGSERTELYPNLNIKSLTIKDDWIYFCNSSDNETLYKIKTDGSNIKKLDDTEYCRCINVVGDWIYYSTWKAGTYKIRPDGSEKTLLTSETTYDMTVVDDWIYYGTNPQFYRMKTDGTQVIKILDSAYYANVINTYVYYEDNDCLYKIKTDGTDNFKLTEGNELADINVVGDLIYYTAWNDNNKERYLCKVRTDGSEAATICKLGADEPNIADGWIYYCSVYDSKYYRIKTDGSNNTLIK
ncbi:MAG: DUF5050 domain-containing protein, partial [Bacteroidota bacterium]|nr:DUF5050 domain-containing protein [Bacteroidota bacterium]